MLLVFICEVRIVVFFVDTEVFQVFHEVSKLEAHARGSEKLRVSELVVLRVSESDLIIIRIITSQFIR